MPECSQGTGVVLEFERAAMNGDPMPDGLSMEEQTMFQALSILYARYRRGEISRETASGDKGKLLYEYDRRKGMVKSGLSITNWHVFLRKEIEAAQCKYRRERTLEAADALSAALDGHIQKASEQTQMKL